MTSLFRELTSRIGISQMLKQSPLGQATVYVETYSPGLLFPIPRALARDKIGLIAPLPFDGRDIWSGYEISWLNIKGKPEIAMAEFLFPCTSLNVIESKSFKLYLNSFNQSPFNSFDEVKKILQMDLSAASGSDVAVDLFPLSQSRIKCLDEFSGICLDSLDVETDIYHVDTNLLVTTPEYVEETVYTNLLKSNCLATGQPDWGSLLVRYAGPKIDHEGLLKYFISFRRHSGFAEHCVEQIFNDIWTKCCPRRLTVYARYTRRGGLDINPFRSNFEKAPANCRHYRQ
jgi:7-cyano-7-deazaguanine reductase